ncbi:MAG: hypothetical protein M1833_003762 [Piccolia ochrophora]|nr:MAG: hypothetical protein M1833_003762 [Piccolia ochrophora]
MATLSHSSVLNFSALCLLTFLVGQCHAFGAGNIASFAKIEGINWRHGDIEDTLLNLLMARVTGGKKFTKMDVKRVYFGNWLRDYSQAVDVGTVKNVSAEAIRILLWVLGFLSFGYGTKEFEVTTARLGCYRPEEHIDNPKDYADNVDARQYDRRLRGPVDERRELSVDPRNGLKNYIASEDLGIATSAGLVRNLFGRSIQLARQYGRSKNEADLYEALRLLGTGCHCIEDFSAHSNYTELALIELGERGVFPHVGRQTAVNIQGARNPVYPLVTGTFGGVDFLHSVMGEVSDKATQSEVDELEGTMQQAQNKPGDSSVLQGLFDSLPSGLIGGNQSGKVDELQQNANAAQMANTHISPRQPEEWTKQFQQYAKQIYPIMEWHDDIMKSLNKTMENIPVLPELLEQFQEQMNIYVFSLLAPFVLPIIHQIKAELNSGSSEVIESSRAKQLIVFHDDHSSDPTHSMLSKDHFSNVLNEPAGKIASQVLKWVIPQVMECWDEERADIDRTLTRIINGVFHHPAMRNYGDDRANEGRRSIFSVVEKWWGERSERDRQLLRDQLSRDGVERGRNHKEGVHDKGHGCGKPLGMPTAQTAGSSGAVGGMATSAVFSGLSGAVAGGSGSSYPGGRPSGGGGAAGDVGKIAGEAVGGGVLGGMVGGLVGGVGSSLLGGVLGGDDTEKKKQKKESHGDDGSYTQTYQETGQKKKKKHHDDEEGYGQAQYSQTSYPGGGGRQDYQTYQQSGSYSGGGFGYQQSQETRPTHGGGYEQKTESRYDRPGSGSHSYERRDEYTSGGQHYSEVSQRVSEGIGGFGSEEYGGRRKDSGSEDDRKKKEKKKHKEEKKYKEEKKHKKEKKHSKHGSGSDSDSDSDDSGKKRHSGHKEKSGGHGSGGYGGSGGGGGGGYGGGYSEQRSGGHGQGYTENRPSGYGSSTGGYTSGRSYGGDEGRSHGGAASYGGQQSYGARDVDTRGSGYVQEQSSYGGGGSHDGRGSYGGESYEPASGYDGGSRRDEYSGQSGGYGGGGEYGASATYGRRDQGESQGTYGRRDEGESQGTYGRRDEREGQEYGGSGGGYGGSGGYGGGGYGEDRY